VRSGRDSADLDGSGRDSVRVRLRAGARRGRGNFDSRDRLRGAGSARDFIDVFRDGRADAALAASIFHFGIENIAQLKRELQRCQHTGEVAMLIPSIDLMGGKIVQLVQGEKKALEFDNLEYWIERFAKYSLVQVIDLDAARAPAIISPSLTGLCAA